MPHYDLYHGVRVSFPAAVLPGLFFGGGQDIERLASRAPRAAGVCECARAFLEDVCVCVCVARTQTRTHNRVAKLLGLERSAHE